MMMGYVLIFLDILINVCLLLMLKPLIISLSLESTLLMVVGLNNNSLSLYHSKKSLIFLLLLAHCMTT